MPKSQKRSEAELIPFSAKIEIIGVNPFVFLPGRVLKSIFKQAGKEKGAIPVRGELNGNPYKQTLLRYLGEWRLYINTTMLKHSPKRIGEKISLTISFDTEDRTIVMHPGLAEALKNNIAAKEVFEKLNPSRQKEIIRYISNLKNEESVNKNIVRAMQFLLGKEGFVGLPKLSKG